ncbi:MAG: hypothetical protein CL969_00860 [Euryarchaeota archaeon]|nr:hypothetical protein [Euryarchaeota archaeon]MDP6378963.1 CBS domain-containing protein [Candidatus Thalassarchaeaceae archaeon]MDP6742027.1 CBS domain-containing protein [Candidatus Thalassarchaeaceae archaeon]MDP7043615.1 CBS domain-containing protein [Candidatus Thalassarchaeaceae archaeon]DAC49035.1 MAG TPA: CBS domain-containing protein [Candidatus Poseidoniales archaeon]
MSLLGARKKTDTNRRSRPSKRIASEIRKLTCGQVMLAAHEVDEMDSIDDVVRLIAAKDWDHVMVTDEVGSLVGRVHAVDLLKLIMNKRINRDLFWMEAVPILQAVTQPPLQVNTTTPLMVAATLMLTHDLNQIAITDAHGVLVGYVSHAVVARHLPRFLL